MSRRCLDEAFSSIQTFESRLLKAKPAGKQGVCWKGHRMWSKDELWFSHIRLISGVPAMCLNDDRLTSKIESIELVLLTLSSSRVADI